MKHLVKALVGAGLLALGLGEPAAAQSTLKIGAVLSVTGPAAFLGEPEEKTIKMYVEKVNREGGVNGKKLELVSYDDGGDANKARTFATRIVEDDKVIAVVGGSITGTTRSEEHTSELQSRQYLVCRLLLEKKKINVACNVTNLSYLSAAVSN